MQSQDREMVLFGLSVPFGTCYATKRIGEAPMKNTPVRESDEAAAALPLQLDSVALARLMEEVRNDSVSQPTAYNRMHNRHNR